MGIMQTLFGVPSRNTSTPDAGVPVNPNMNPQGQVVSNTNVSSPANPNVPSGVASPAHSAEKAVAGESPLDGFKDLWQPVKVEEGAQPPASIVPFLDPTKLRESISKANFTQNISPELMKKAMTGDADAFQQVMNETAKASFEQALLASRTLTETSINAWGDAQTKNLPGLVKSQMVRDTMATNPLYQHEATKPLMAALEVQLSQKYPTASANEITQHAKNYIDQFVQVASPKEVAEVRKINRRDDFSGF